MATRKIFFVSIINSLFIVGVTSVSLLLCFNFQTRRFLQKHFNTFLWKILQNWPLATRFNVKTFLGKYNSVIFANSLPSLTSATKFAWYIYLFYAHTVPLWSRENQMISKRAGKHKNVLINFTLTETFLPYCQTKGLSFNEPLFDYLNQGHFSFSEYRSWQANYICLK